MTAVNDLWSYLETVDRPIVLYGTGDGADKILAELDRRGIPVADIFASDGFVRNRVFREKKVISYEEARRRHGDGMILLLAFGSSRPEIIGRFYALANRHEFYAPDVPVAGGELFTASFARAHEEELRQARELFSDDESKALFDSVIRYRLSGDIRFLSEPVTDPDRVFSTLLHPESYRLAADLGAYTGDTALFLLKRAPKLEALLALEPDSRNFGKLCLNTAPTKKVEAHLVAAWNRPDVLPFSQGGGRGIRHSEGKKAVQVRALPLDFLLDGRRPDFIKFDVEGAEREALEGCAGSISAHSPELQVALYHRSEDLFSLPLLLHRLNPSYSFYLRRFPCIPAWDLNLFAVKNPF